MKNTKALTMNEPNSPEYDLRPQLKPSAAANRVEKSETVSNQVVKKYDI